MRQKRFATAINCIDGRVQEPVIAWIKEHYNVDFVDMITEPGIVKCLATEPLGPTATSIREKIDISRQQHGSDLVAVIAHDDCVGNPADKNTQIHQLNTASDLIYIWGEPIDIIRLWVDTHNTVHQLP